MLVSMEPFISRNIHPTVIVRACNKALESAMRVCEEMALEVDVNDRELMMRLLRSTIGTKFSSRFGDLICGLALDAVMTVADQSSGAREVDIKRYIRVEKVC